MSVIRILFPAWLTLFQTVFILEEVYELPPEKKVVDTVTVAQSANNSRSKAISKSKPSARTKQEKAQADQVYSE